MAEPTGVASKYWDGVATTEQATKLVAKERIVQTARSEASVPHMAVKDRSWLIGVAAIGVSIARDFGGCRGVCFGKIERLDESRTPHWYHCIYTDGDEAVFDRDELVRGYELFGAMALGTHKPVNALVSDGSSEDKSASEDAWSEDSEHETKVKRRARTKTGRQRTPCKRKASTAEPVAGLKGSPNKKCKKTSAKVGITKLKSKKPAAKDGVTKVTKLTVKSSFSLSDVLTAWTDTSDFGASFRALNEADQKKELAQINLGAAKGIKGAVKSKLLNQYKEMMANKMKEYIQSNMVKADDMFRANAVTIRAAQILRPGFLSVGEWVEVDADRTPGWNSEGGIAVIIHVHDNFADVK